MHELSIAAEIVDIASTAATRVHARRVARVFLRMGPLAGVVRDALEFSFGIAADGTACEGSELVVDEVPLLLYCPRCDAVQEAAGPFAFSCPACGQPTCDVRQGRELEVTSIEIHEPSNAHEPAHR